MFGKNPLEKKDKRTEANELRVVGGKPFLTVQGEGPFSGERAIFIRLWGCNLKCWFCDTEFSDPKDPFVSNYELLEDCMTLSRNQPQDFLVVLTGGEPLRQPIAQLCKLLLEAGFRIQVETSGSLWRSELEGLQISYVVSPKTGRVQPEIASRAVAYKYIINEGEDNCPIDGLPVLSTQVKGAAQRLARPPQGFEPSHVYLSPCDVYDEEQNRKNHLWVAGLCMKYGYRAQVQVHKYLGVA